MEQKNDELECIHWSFLGSKSTLDYVGRGFDHGYFCTLTTTAYDAIHTHTLSHVDAIKSKE